MPIFIVAVFIELTDSSSQRNEITLKTSLFEGGALAIQLIGRIFCVCVMPKATLHNIYDANPFWTDALL